MVKEDYWMNIQEPKVAYFKSISMKVAITHGFQKTELFV